MQDKVQIIHKKVKHINLKVKPNLEVILTVPLKTNQKIIDDILSKRTQWIQQKLDYFKQHIKPIPELISGEDFSYLGQSYRLKIIQGEHELAELSDEHFILTLKDKTNHNKKLQLIDAWYREKASYHFNRLLDKYLKIVNKTVNKITIRRMKTRWGSCNPKKAYINLNLELIKKDILGIEYVVLHELAHLTHYNHDKKFYGYVASYMPDWQSRKKRLL